jgi:hypothetical protein
MGYAVYYYDHRIENLAFILNNSYLFHSQEEVYEKQFCKMFLWPFQPALDNVQSVYVPVHDISCNPPIYNPANCMSQISVTLPYFLFEEFILHTLFPSTFFFYLKLIKGGVFICVCLLVKLIVRYSPCCYSRPLGCA